MNDATRREFLKYGGAVGTALGAGGLPRIAQAQEVLKIGAVYVSPVAEIGWTKQHSLGVDAIKAEFGDKVELTVIDNIFMPQDAERIFRELATAGNKLIFGTSFSHGTPMQKVAPRFPEVAFEHCSGIVHLANLGTFEAKYYEGTFVAGAAGGSHVEGRQDRLHRRLPDPRHRRSGQRAAARRAKRQSGGHLQRDLPQFLVRSGQGKGGGQHADFARLRRHLLDDRHRRPAFRWLAKAAPGRSATPATWRSSVPASS